MDKIKVIWKYHPHLLLAPHFKASTLVEQYVINVMVKEVQCYAHPMERYLANPSIERPPLK